MEEKISAYLKAIRSDAADIKLCDDVMDYISGLYSEEIVPIKETIAALYCGTLAAYQILLDDEDLKQKRETIVKAFLAIAQMAREISDQDDSDLVIIHFLNELYTRREEAKIDSNLTDEKMKLLLPELKSIQFIFKMEDEKGKIFPIHRLLADVISDSKFLNTKVELYHVYMLQLAVELFEDIKERECVSQLKEKCNLKFIEYMDGTHKLIDTSDMLNYIQNRVMIFYNPKLSSVLIRHENRHYFKEEVLKEFSCKVQEEINYAEDTIGYFVELPIEVADINFTDFSDVIKESPEEFLRLIYDRECKNVFLENAIIKRDGTLFPVNPFCISDKKLVKGKMGGKNGKSYDADEMLNLLRRYRMNCVTGNGLDIITLGLCIRLLEEDNIGVDVLMNFGDTGDTWLQNVIIRNWVEAASDRQGAFQFVLELWLNELEYMDKDLNNFKMEKFGYVYPFPFDLAWAYEFLGFDTKEPSIFVGEVISDEEKGIGIEIKKSKTLAGKNLGSQSVIFKDKINLPESANDKEYFLIGSEHFLHRSENQDWHGNPELDKIFKMISEIEKKSRTMLDDRLRIEAHEAEVSYIMGLMELNKDALMMPESRKLSDDFKSVAICRLIHNLIWNKITREKWEAYYKILNMHQKLSFEEIGDDDYFRMQDSGTLYVMKDNEEQDAVLKLIYQKYLKKTYERDPGPFLKKLRKGENEKYYLDDKEIQKIVFLFDTLESGTATIRTMALYLGKVDEWKDLDVNKSKDSKKIDREITKYSKYLQTYECEEEKICVKQIVETNKPQIVVHSYYGTDEGIKNVTDFLQKGQYAELIAKVDYCLEITAQKAQSIEEDCRMIWPGQQADLNCYMVVREFNMTKRNVFPEGMCGDVTNAICMFVKKAERQ